ncbi:MAG: class I SAM-dependent methyltransferase [Actinobacteria bacterium]|nr:class I SAM-dependent methyltransferase [Actinomycetota bacterium]
MTTQPIDGARLDAFIGQVVSEAGAALNAALVVIGDKLGLYRGLADGGPATSHELAARTGTDERYVREWLAAQAAGGFVAYDAAAGNYELPAEQALALTQDDSPAFVPGLFQVVVAAIHDSSHVLDAFRSGDGVGWHEHHSDLFVGTERFFRPAYAANLVSTWIPALDGVEEKLVAGGRVADVGCGHGASTVLMATAYPESTFVGFDSHESSIDVARKRAAQAGVSDRVRFDVAGASDFPGSDYDLVTFFDCLHDMGDPAGAASHVRSALGRDGTWMIVEPLAGNRVEENLHPIGRLYYSVSTLVCTPASLSQPGRAALGAQAGEARIRDVALAGGFTSFRRAAEAPANVVFEAKTA